ncbi:LPS export ABC transporter periplasmic protein LptC [Franzmannia qiaohouensis]|uniref:LPS export ABC transporter periplasmic protein LptC n=1 Tax=Franzmannia qiaohouensis TaxID=1329370 RepID=A0ABU1HFE6_9GAMM|nr:LPS export ABC transporter periplasmic protein LptC [Halomonas qiaohouensis]MDR5905504.1 LPS export ABC transporter periplasmic protein LptC [Halomonas qiaohouensis]
MAIRLPRPSYKLWLLLLLLMLGGVLALFEQRDSFGPGPVPRDAAGEPDYYLEDATMTRFDAQGRPHQRLVTPRLVHTPHDDITRTQTPVSRLLDSEGRTWFGFGDVGTLGPGNERLTLAGNARLEAPDEGWRLETNVLHVDLDIGHAFSETTATLYQPPQWTRGERFDAWIDEDRMRLTDNVRGHHPPEGSEEPAS